MTLRHFIDLSTLDRETIRGILSRAAAVKAEFKSGVLSPLLKNKTLAMIFEKIDTDASRVL